MVDRLRVFACRPLQDADRPRLFALAVAVIVAVAVAFALLDDAGSSPVAAPAERPLPPPPPSSPGTPAERPTPPATRADVAQVKRTARRFLAGYLPYTYGASPRIAAASAQLRGRLARERPRVPAAERRRRPRIEHLQTEGTSRRHADVVALVSDGARRYSVPIELSRTAAGWRVIDVGS